MSIRRGRRTKRHYQFEGMTPSLEARTLLTYMPVAELFRVNEAVEGIAINPRAATSPEGVTTVVWQDRQENGDSLMARRLDAQGQPLNDQFLVRAASDDVWSDILTVGFDDQSNLWVVWQESSGDDRSLLVQRYDAAGEALGETQVLSTEIGSLPLVQVLPQGGLAALTTGEFLSPNYYFYHFDTEGELASSNDLGDPTNDGWTYNYSASLALTGEGVVISWSEKTSEETDPEVFLYSSRSWARILDLDGVQIGDDILLASVSDATAEGETDNPFVRLHSLAGGGFLATWTEYSLVEETPNEERWAQIYDDEGVITGDPFLISPEGTNVLSTDIAQLSNGNFVTLTSELNEAEEVGYTFRILSATGEAITGWTPIDTEGYALGYPNQLSATSDAGFQILWDIVTDPPAENDGVYTQFFAEAGLADIDPDLYIDKEDGVWVWSGTNGEALLSPWEAEALLTDENGRAFIDFGQEGLWTWTAGDSEATLYNAADPSQFLIAPDGSLFIAYNGFGLWHAQDGVFTQINEATPYNFIISQTGVLFLDYGQFGVWQRGTDGAFLQVNAAAPEALATTPNGDLYIDYGQYGIWVWNPSSIVQINEANPESMTASTDGSVFFAFGEFGLWRWNSEFQKIDDASPVSLLSAADGVMYLNFGANGFSSWTAEDGLVQLHEGEAESEIIGRDGLLYLVFGPDDVQRQDEPGEFTQVDMTGVRRLFS